MDAHRCSTSTAALTLGLGTRYRWVAIFTFRLLFSRKRTPITTAQEAERVPDLVWKVLEERKPLSHAGIQTTEPSSPAASRYTDYAIPAHKMNCDCGTWLRRLLPITKSADMQTGNVYAEAIFNQHPTQPVSCHFAPPFPLKTLDLPQILCQMCLSQSHKITSTKL